MRKAPKGEAKKRQHGPPKEKVQITVRLDQDLMKVVYQQMQEDNTRLTDIIERGLTLALKERDYDLPLIAKRVRFMVANATKEQQGLIEGLLIAMVESQLDKKVFAASAEHEKCFDMVKWWLESCRKTPHAAVCLEQYSRYGKTAEEIAKLGSL